MKTLCMLLCASVLWIGCGREEEEVNEEERERGTSAPEGETMQDRRENAAARTDEPRAENEAAPGSAEPTGEPKNEAPGSARRAEADLDGVGDARMEGKAILEEQGDAVAVTVRLEGAAPGERAVRIYERASCEGIDKKAQQGAPGSSPSMSDLGTVTIGADGKGVLQMKTPSATLKPDDSASLLGKALVVQGANAPPGTARVPTAAGDSMACGMIRAPAADEKAAPRDDKAAPREEKR